MCQTLIFVVKGKRSKQEENPTLMENDIKMLTIISIVEIIFTKIKF